MKDIAVMAITDILFATICATFTWGVFGFIVWDWDITEWTFIGRGCLVFVTAILFCAGVAKPRKE